MSSRPDNRQPQPRPGALCRHFRIDPQSRLATCFSAAVRYLREKDKYRDRSRAVYAVIEDEGVDDPRERSELMGDLLRDGLLRKRAAEIEPTFELEPVVVEALRDIAQGREPRAWSPPMSSRRFPGSRSGRRDEPQPPQERERDEKRSSSTSPFAALCDHFCIARGSMLAVCFTAAVRHLHSKPDAVDRRQLVLRAIDAQVRFSNERERTQLLDELLERKLLRQHTGETADEDQFSLTGRVLDAFECIESGKPLPPPPADSIMPSGGAAGRGRNATLFMGDENDEKEHDGSDHDHDDRDGSRSDDDDDDDTGHGRRGRRGGRRRRGRGSSPRDPDMHQRGSRSQQQQQQQRTSEAPPRQQRGVICARLGIDPDSQLARCFTIVVKHLREKEDFCDARHLINHSIRSEMFPGASTRSYVDERDALVDELCDRGLLHCDIMNKEKPGQDELRLTRKVIRALDESKSVEVPSATPTIAQPVPRFGASSVVPAAPSLDASRRRERSSSPAPTAPALLPLPTAPGLLPLPQHQSARAEAASASAAAAAASWINAAPVVHPHFVNPAANVGGGQTMPISALPVLPAVPVAPAAPTAATAAVDASRIPLPPPQYLILGTSPISYPPPLLIRSAQPLFRPPHLLPRVLTTPPPFALLPQPQQGFF